MFTIFFTVFILLFFIFIFIFIIIIRIWWWLRIWWWFRIRTRIIIINNIINLPMIMCWCSMTMMFFFMFFTFIFKLFNINLTKNNFIFTIWRQYNIFIISCRWVFNSNYKCISALLQLTFLWDYNLTLVNFTKTFLFFINNF